MRLVTFDPFRTLGMPGVKYIKPTLYLEHGELLRQGRGRRRRAA
jgi:hypothetical protein